MMRKMIQTAAALTLLTLGPAFAQTYELDITAQLREQGYQNITLSHTWLGRTRIVALLGSDLRECDVNGLREPPLNIGYLPAAANGGLALSFGARRSNPNDLFTPIYCGSLDTYVATRLHRICAPSHLGRQLEIRLN